MSIYFYFIDIFLQCVYVVHIFLKKFVKQINSGLKETFLPRPSTNPTIFAYVLGVVVTHNSLLKIGYTNHEAQTHKK